jgi:hypothetical protein
MKIFNQIPGPTDWDYDSDAKNRFDLHDFFFLKDPRWMIVDTFEEAEIIPLFPPTNMSNLLRSDIRLRDDQTGWIMHHFAIDDHMTQTYMENLLVNYSHLGKNIVISHKNNKLKDLDHPKIFYFDSMFDVCKLYFTEYDKELLKDKIWVRHSKKEFFNMPDIAENPMKKFINAMYLYKPYDHPRMKYRHLLRKIVNEYEELGYIGNEDNRLLPNNPHWTNIQKIMNGPIQWYPLADQYYQDTYLSVVMETVMGVDRLTGEIFETGCVTEKTLEPLAKGNFIIPYGYPGLIKDILDYGFRLPDWIDYGYDKIIDPDERFAYFAKSLKKILEMPMDEVMNVHYQKDKVDILEHNRQVFFDRPYDDLYGKLKNIVDNLPR